MTMTSIEDFAALIRRTGVPVVEADLRQLHDAWALIEPMLDRLRPHGRDQTAEPAHVFLPDIDQFRTGNTEAV